MENKTDHEFDQFVKQVNKQIAGLQKTVSQLAAIINIQEKKIRQVKTENFMLKSKVEGLSNLINNHNRG